MKGHSNWSYAPYKPLMTNCGDIYINRIVPKKTRYILNGSRQAKTNIAYILKKQRKVSIFLGEKQKTANLI